MLVAEAQLSRAVFDSPYAEAAFDEIVSKQAIDLTKFGQAILQSRRTPEKVWRGFEPDKACLLTMACCLCFCLGLSAQTHP